MTPEELEKCIFETIKEETGMSSVDDIEGFNISLGQTSLQVSDFK